MGQPTVRKTVFSELFENQAGLVQLQRTIAIINECEIVENLHISRIDNCDGRLWIFCNRISVILFSKKYVQS